MVVVRALSPKDALLVGHALVLMLLGLAPFDGWLAVGLVGAGLGMLVEAGFGGWRGRSIARQAECRWAPTLGQ